MLIRYVIPGLIKLALIVLMPPLILGAAAGLFWPKDYKKWTKRLLIAFIVVIEIAVFLEKSQPFFFGNVYNMVAMTPNFALHLVIGLIGDGLWLFLSLRSAAKWAEKTAKHRK